ncbi:MFS transporter [Amphibacillus indicireducens]|uniref:MFS transporter n=1 Tax=Amphibacillus indicireducens TaxID=1076330 RepID=A0ABP7W1Z0_9BACI
MIYFIYLLIVVALIDVLFQLTLISLFTLAFLLYGLSLILGSLISGFCLDKFDFKLIGAIGLFATGFILLGYLLTDAQLLHFFHGLASGLLLPVPFVYLAKLKHDTTKHRLILFSCLSIALALIVGSVLGLMIEPKFSQNYVVVPLGILMIIAAVLVLVLLPSESKVTEENRTLSATLNLVKSLLNEQQIGFAYGGALLFMFVNGALAYLLPVKIDALGYDNHLFLLLLVTVALVSSLIYVLPINRLDQRFSKSLLMTVGVLIQAICLFLLGVFKLKTLLFIVIILYGIGFAAVLSSILTLVVDGSVQANRGIAYGLLACFSTFGLIFGVFIPAFFPTLFTSFFISGLVLTLCSAYLFASIKLNQGASS